MGSQFYRMQYACCLLNRKRSRTPLSIAISVILLQSIGYVYTGLMQAVGASSKVFEYIDRKPELKPDGKLAPDTLKGKLEFRNVSFAYPSRPNSKVLQVGHRLLSVIDKCLYIVHLNT